MGSLLKLLCFTNACNI